MPSALLSSATDVATEQLIVATAQQIFNLKKTIAEQINSIGRRYSKHFTTIVGFTEFSKNRLKESIFFFDFPGLTELVKQAIDIQTRLKRS